jgi:hypothetical protein
MSKWMQNEKKNKKVQLSSIGNMNKRNVSKKRGEKVR